LRPETLFAQAVDLSSARSKRPGSGCNLEPCLYAGGGPIRERPGRRAFDARLRNEAFHVVAIARASRSFAAVDQMAGSLMLVFLRKASLGGN